MSNLFSVETQRNWERLGVLESSEKLKKRANKTKSDKRFVPVECLSHVSVNAVQEIVDFITERDIATETAIFTFAVRLLKNVSNHLGKKWFFSQYKENQENEELACLELPSEEDILGIIYQSLMREGEKNIKGSYYTPSQIVAKMTSSFDFENGETFLDPACGSGAFLISLNCRNPEQMYGVDIDTIAVMIARVNLILKYDGIEFIPRIYEFNFLGNESKMFEKISFDYIATNPPWGSVKRSGLTSSNLIADELFSCFLYKSLEILKQNGELSYLLPNSFLNVKCHTSIRKHLVENFSIKKVECFNNIFSNVTTDFIAITVEKSLTTFDKTPKYIFVDKEKNEHEVLLRNSSNFAFNMITSKDNEIIESVNRFGEYTLTESVWGLGIVTGDNANKLLDKPVLNAEPIYTGKEITPFVLKEPRKFVVYNRANFQQVASDTIYRASEKLLYKFISSKLIFAYDNKKSLCLNSANVLIPKIPNYSVKTVMAFLNSDLFQFLYTKQFGQVKILKGNLCELRFPRLNDEQNEVLLALADSGDAVKINEYIFDFYNISSGQQNYIKEVLG